MQIAFLQETSGKKVDLEAAWKLLDLSLIEVKEDGEVTGMRDAVHNALRRYPHLVKEQDDASAKTQPDPRAGSAQAPFRSYLQVFPTTPLGHRESDRKESRSEFEYRSVPEYKLSERWRGLFWATFEPLVTAAAARNPQASSS